MTAPLEFDDDHDHVVNAVLRLLGLDEEELERWRALTGEYEGDALARLARAWSALRPPPRPPGAVNSSAPVEPGPGGRPGVLWQPAIPETPEFGFARSSDRRLAWLVRYEGERWSRVSEPPLYEEAYFEGDRESGGYGAYRAEAGWRLEKAARQVREMRSATGLKSGLVLDIGSGYGYFRAALEDAGYAHEGLEVSAHGRAQAREVFGQETHAALLEDCRESWPERFDAVTGFDLIEHLPDPALFLSSVHHILRPGGCLGLKTPNVDSPEAELFGPYYHSLKREHLVLFSPASLTACVAEAGFEPISLSTVSHLLRGFVGRETCDAWEREGRGADIVAWYRRPR